MESVLGAARSRQWADDTVMSALGGRTAAEALAAGVPPRQVWAAVAEALDVPPKDR